MSKVTQPFSNLEKDQKTYEHVCEYYKAIETGKKLFEVDNFLQMKELEAHLLRVGKDSKDIVESSVWADMNAEKMRAYINSLKMTSLFMYIVNRMEYRDKVPYPMFEQMVDIWNQEQDLVICSIRVHDEKNIFCKDIDN